MLLFAVILIVLVGVAHSFLGERYILIRLFRHPLPELFGSDDFTRKMLRFAWHITTVAWLALVASRGRHLSWLAFGAIAAACFLSQ